jgi:hypothetical protein
MYYSTTPHLPAFQPPRLLYEPAALTKTPALPLQTCTMGSTVHNTVDSARFTAGAATLLHTLLLLCMSSLPCARSYTTRLAGAVVLSQSCQHRFSLTNLAHQANCMCNWLVMSAASCGLTDNIICNCHQRVHGAAR